VQKTSFDALMAPRNVAAGSGFAVVATRYRSGASDDGANRTMLRMRKANGSSASEAAVDGAGVRTSKAGCVRRNASTRRAKATLRSTRRA